MLPPAPPWATLLTKVVPLMVAELPPLKGPATLRAPDWAVPPVNPPVLASPPTAWFPLRVELVTANTCPNHQMPPPEPVPPEPPDPGPPAPPLARLSLTVLPLIVREP